MTPNDSKSYLSYLNKLVDHYSNTYHHSINKKPINPIETNPKALKLKANYRVRINKHKNIFSIGYTENQSKEISVIDSVLNTNPWANKIKHLNRKKSKFL